MENLAGENKIRRVSWPTNRLKGDFCPEMSRICGETSVNDRNPSNYRQNHLAFFLAADPRFEAVFFVSNHFGPQKGH